MESETYDNFLEDWDITYRPITGAVEIHCQHTGTILTWTEFDGWTVMVTICDPHDGILKHTEPVSMRPMPECASTLEAITFGALWVREHLPMLELF